MKQNYTIIKNDSNVSKYINDAINVPSVEKKQHDFAVVISDAVKRFMEGEEIDIAIKRFCSNDWGASTPYTIKEQNQKNLNTDGPVFAIYAAKRYDAAYVVQRTRDGVCVVTLTEFKKILSSLSSFNLNT